MLRDDETLHDIPEDNQYAYPPPDYRPPAAQAQPGDEAGRIGPELPDIPMSKLLEERERLRQTLAVDAQQAPSNEPAEGPNLWTTETTAKTYASLLFPDHPEAREAFLRDITNPDTIAFYKHQYPKGWTKQNDKIPEKERIKDDELVNASHEWLLKQNLHGISKRPWENARVHRTKWHEVDFMKFDAETKASADVLVKANAFPKNPDMADIEWIVGSREGRTLLKYLGILQEIGVRVWFGKLIFPTYIEGTAWGWGYLMEMNDGEWSFELPGTPYKRHYKFSGFGRVARFLDRSEMLLLLAMALSDMKADKDLFSGVFFGT